MPHPRCSTFVQLHFNMMLFCFSTNIYREKSERLDCWGSGSLASSWELVEVPAGAAYGKHSPSQPRKSTHPFLLKQVTALSPVPEQVVVQTHIEQGTHCHPSCMTGMFLSCKDQELETCGFKIAVGGGWRRWVVMEVFANRPPVQMRASSRRNYQWW